MNLLFLAALLLTATQNLSCAAPPQHVKNGSVARDPVLLESESGLRELLKTIYPNLTSLFYYYDGDQVFGLFELPEVKGKVLLILSPNASVEKFEVFQEDKSIKVFVEPLRAKFGVKNASSGGFDRDDVFETQFGVWLSIPETEEVRFEVQLHQGIGKYHMAAARTTAGKWKGEMRRVEPPPEELDRE